MPHQSIGYNLTLRKEKKSPLTNREVDNNFLYNSSSAALAYSSSQANSSAIAGNSHWDITGNDIYNNNSGVVCIGTSTPNRTLTVGGATGTGYFAGDLHLGANSSIQFEATPTGVSHGAMYRTNTDSIRIFSPDAVDASVLMYTGNSGASGYYSFGLVQEYSVGGGYAALSWPAGTATGMDHLQIDSGTGRIYRDTSTLKSKKNVTPFTMSVEIKDAFLNLEPKYFKSKADDGNDGWMLGLIAEEAEKVTSSSFKAPIVHYERDIIYNDKVVPLLDGPFTPATASNNLVPGNIDRNTYLSLLLELTKSQQIEIDTLNKSLTSLTLRVATLETYHPIKKK